MRVSVDCMSMPGGSLGTHQFNKVCSDWIEAFHFLRYFADQKTPARGKVRIMAFGQQGHQLLRMRVRAAFEFRQQRRQLIRHGRELRVVKMMLGRGRDVLRNISCVTGDDRTRSTFSPTRF